MRNRPLPTLPKYLPAGAEPNSERYITGPDSLARFAPAIPPSTAAFHFNAEAELAKYGEPGKETTLIVFSYPTMEMARDRIAAFPADSRRHGQAHRAAGRAGARSGESRTRPKGCCPRVKYQAEVTASGTCSDAQGQSGEPVS